MNMRPAVENALIIAHWMNRQADSEDRRLQPSHLHCLLYLAQAVYAIEHDGALLMPANFLAFANGPREPTLFAVMGEITQGIHAMPPPVLVGHFLNRFWIKFAGKMVNVLLEDIKRHPPFKSAIMLGEGELIPLHAILSIKPTERNSPSHLNRVISTNGQSYRKWQPPKWSPKKHIKSLPDE